MRQPGWVRGYRVTFAILTLLAIVYQFVERRNAGNFDVGWYPYPFLNPANVGGYLGVTAYCTAIALGQRVRLRVEATT